MFEKSFPQSARPTLRYILPEFGCRSPLQHAILYPRIGGNLKYTAGKYHSIYGDVGVKWEVQGKQITLTVQIPVNTTAEIRLDQAKAVLESDGLTFTREADYMAAEAGSGTYHIAFEQ